MELTHQEHDQITADTQAVTHLAFMTMGSTWKTEKTYPVYFTVNFSGRIPMSVVLKM